MTIERTLTLVLSIAALALVPTLAAADVVTYDGTGFSQNVKVHADGYLSDGKKVQAGEMNLSVGGTPYVGWCVDLDHWADDGEGTMAPLSSIANGNLAAWLHETYAEDVDSGLDAAALACAIWEVTHETEDTFDLALGSFSISDNASALSAGNALLAGLPDSYDPPFGYGVLEVEDAQNFLIFGPDQVPEPGTMILLGLGAAGLAVRRRRTA